MIPKSATQVSRYVEKALKQIDTERALTKASLLPPDELAERHKKLEEKLQFLIPNGHKEIEALVKISDSMLEIEIGRAHV